MHHHSFRNLTVLAVAIAALVIFGIWFFSRPAPQPSPELGTPKLSLASLDAAQRSKPLYFDRAALPWIKEHWQQWAAAYGGAAAPSPEELVAEFDQGLQSSKAWRVLDRKWRFGAVLLTGDPAVFRPLLDALREAPDWTLTNVDPTSYLFERVEGAQSPRAWRSATDAKALLAAFDKHPVREQVMARVQIAHRTMFLGDLEGARKLLDEAFKLEPKSKEAWTELAALEGMSNRWQESCQAATNALAKSRSYRPAKLALVNALYGMGRFNEALEYSRELYDAGPVDAELLFLHAKVTHAAHAFQEEIDVLRRLIALLQGRSQPVGLWLIYLGQAYSATGESLQAQEQLQSALKDETLRPSDREFILKALERLNTRGEAIPDRPGSATE